MLRTRITSMHAKPVKLKQPVPPDQFAAFLRTFRTDRGVMQLLEDREAEKRSDAVLERKLREKQMGFSDFVI